MKIYINIKLDDAAEQLFVDGTRGHEIVRGQPIASVIAAGHGDSLDGVDIAFGQPDPAALVNAKSVQFVQLTSAGWARYDRDEVKDALEKNGTKLSNASSVYAPAVAEHAVAMLLSLERYLPRALDAQRGGEGWIHKALRPVVRILRGQRVLMLGYGAIARAMAERLKPFECELVGYRRHVRGDETIRVVDASGLDAEWAAADHIVDLLPEGDETEGFIDAARLARSKHGARLYNLGRGSTIDRAALVDALRNGTIEAAYLDVTSPEPLPSDDALWKEPNVFVTPHVGGGHVGEFSTLVRHFLANLDALAQNRPLIDRVV